MVFNMFADNSSINGSDDLGFLTFQIFIATGVNIKKLRSGSKLR